MGDEAPVLVMVCAPREQTDSGAGPAATRTAGASIYPAVQNMLLAARAHGIAGCLTTIHLYREAKAKAVLGIPDDVDTYALVPLGYPAQPNAFGPVRRKPVGEVAFVDGWGTPLPT
jgi:nitroreductase